MPANLIGSDFVGFNDGNGGHVYTFPAGAPTVGQWDILCVNSNTIVATPSGFIANQEVDGQGSYFFRRKAIGGEAATVTVTTTGNENTDLVWSRWGSTNAADDFTGNTAASAGGTSASQTTNPLAETNELVIAFAALHHFSSTPTSPSWVAGYTPMQAGSQGTGPSGCAAFVAYKTNAGTAAETPSVTWTNGADDHYMLVLTFTTFSDGAAADTVTTTDAATRTATFIRSTTDSVTTTDAATRAATLGRSGTDTVITTDAATRAAIALTRSTSDTVTTSDAATATFTAGRSATDTVSTSDAAARTITFTRASNDTVTTSDTANATGGARTITIVFGQPQPKWLFGTLRNTNGTTAGGGVVLQSVLSTDDVQIPASAFQVGAPIDPTSDLIEMAFTTVGDDPGSGDWHTGSWDTAPGGTFLAQCLVGPGAGGVTLGRGIYAVWVRITDNPTIPVAEVGQLQIV